MKTESMQARHARQAEVLANVGRAWRKYGTYKNKKTARTMVSYLRWSKGVWAVEPYPFGTFEATVRNETEVWVRRA